MLPKVQLSLCHRVQCLALVLHDVLLEANAQVIVSPIMTICLASTILSVR